MAIGKPSGSVSETPPAFYRIVAGYDGPARRSGLNQSIAQSAEVTGNSVPMPTKMPVISTA